MHELSLAQNVLETVTELAEQHRIHQITSIRLVVGPLSGVMPEALEFGLQVLSQGTLAEGARIEILRPALVGACRSCGNRVELEDWEPICPDCGAPALEIVQGEELRIESFEGD